MHLVDTFLANALTHCHSIFLFVGTIHPSRRCLNASSAALIFSASIRSVDCSFIAFPTNKTCLEIFFDIFKAEIGIDLCKMKKRNLNR